MKLSKTRPLPILEPWADPPAMNPGATRPELYFSRDLYCTYYLPDAGNFTGNGQIAVLRFSGVLHFRMGQPNDEVLGGHPLYKAGLGFYGFFRVLHSPLIAEIEERNAVHRQHQPGIYSKFNHWIATFHDETLEVISRQASFLGVSELVPRDAIRTFTDAGAEKR
jgi:hypothetical protein